MTDDEIRAYRVVDLGPRPGWWRPFRRRRWDRKVAAAQVVTNSDRFYYGSVLPLYRLYYSDPAYFEKQNRRINFANLRMEKRQS